MKTLRNLSIIALAGTLLFGVTACFKHSPEEKAEWITDRIASKLELDETQKGKLINLKEEIMKARSELQADRESSFDEVKTMVNSEVISRDSVRALFDQKHQKVGQLADPIIDSLVDFHASLNVEQKQKVIEFMEKHKERGDHRWGHHW